MPLSTDKITMTAEELQSAVAEEVENRLALLGVSPALTTGEHLAVRAWLTYTLNGGNSHYRHDNVIDTLLLNGVIDERQVLHVIHAERENRKGAAARYDKFFFETIEDDEPEQEGEDA